MLSAASLTQARGRSPLCSALLSCISLGAAVDNMVFASCDNGILGILVQVLKVGTFSNTSFLFYILFLFSIFILLYLISSPHDSSDSSQKFQEPDHHTMGAECSTRCCDTATDSTHLSTALISIVQ